MSTLSVSSLSSQAAVAVPAALAFIGLVYSPARPLIGLGIVAALLMLFKPLVAGIVRAALLSITKVQSRSELLGKKAAHSALVLNRMANEVAESQPNLASELRMMAAGR